MKIRIKKSPVYKNGGSERNSDFGKQRNYALDTSWFPYGTTGDDKYDNSMSKLPEVPEELSNAELESNEVVMSTDQDGQPMQYKVPGNINNKHYNNGYTTILQPGDFVFSDTKKLKIKDKELLKYFGKGGKATTPAKIAKGYNIKPYQNTLIDPTADAVDKQTAQMMVDNYMSKLNDLALIQESQKGFPQGIPSLSDGMMKMGGKYKCQYGGIGPTPYQEPISVQPQFPTDWSSLYQPTAPYQWKEGDPVTVTPYDYGTPEENMLPTNKTAKLITPTPQITNNVPPAPPVIPGEQKGPLQGPTPGAFNPQSGKKPPFAYTGADSMAMANAFAQLGSAKKYLPWEANPELRAPQYSQFDPSREIAATSETVNSLANAAALTGNPQLNRALYSQMAGQQAGNVANIMGRYNSMNIEQSNRQADVDTQTSNQNAMMRGDRATRLFDKTTVANQQFDNTLRSLQNNYTGANINAWNNRMNLYNMNVENPQYYVDPLSGKVVFKGNQTAMSAGSAQTDLADEIGKLYQQYKNEGFDDTTARELAKIKAGAGQVSTQNRNTRTRATADVNNPMLYQGMNPYQQ